MCECLAFQILDARGSLVPHRQDASVIISGSTGVPGCKQKHALLDSPLQRPAFAAWPVCPPSAMQRHGSVAAGDGGLDGGVYALMVTVHLLVVCMYC